MSQVDDLAVYMRPLTNRQQRFVEEYLVDLNATQAAIRAGYSPKSAVYSGKRNLDRDDIRAAVADAMKERADRTEVTADRVLREIAALAFVDPSTIMRMDGRRGVVITDTAKLTEDQRRCIVEMSESREGSIKCRIADKLKALEMLGRHLGLWVDRMEVTGQGGGPLRTQAMTDEELERIAGSGDGDT